MHTIDSIASIEVIANYIDYFVWNGVMENELKQDYLDALPLKWL